VDAKGEVMVTVSCVLLLSFSLMLVSNKTKEPQSASEMGEMVV
jgi:hypothetical protein